MFSPHVNSRSPTLTKTDPYPLMSQGDGVEEVCEEMCPEAGGDVDAAGGGPENPFADTVASALSAGCVVGCGMVIDDPTVDYGTEAAARAICGYCHIRGG